MKRAAKPQNHHLRTKRQKSQGPQQNRAVKQAKRARPRRRWRT